MIPAQVWHETHNGLPFWTMPSKQYKMILPKQHKLSMRDTEGTMPKHFFNKNMKKI